jgi:hypothetical protein
MARREFTSPDFKYRYWYDDVDQVVMSEIAHKGRTTRLKWSWVSGNARVSLTTKTGHRYSYTRAHIRSMLAPVPSNEEIRTLSLLAFDAILYMPGVSARFVKKGTQLKNIAAPLHRAVLIDPTTWKRYKIVESVRLVPTEP